MLFFSVSKLRTFTLRKSLSNPLSNPILKIVSKSTNEWKNMYDLLSISALVRFCWAAIFCAITYGSGRALMLVPALLKWNVNMKVSSWIYVLQGRAGRCKRVTWSGLKSECKHCIRPKGLKFHQFLYKLWTFSMCTWEETCITGADSWQGIKHGSLPDIRLFPVFWLSLCQW